MKIFKKMLIGLIAVIVLFSFVKDITLRYLVRHVLNQQMGVQSDIEYFHLGIVRPGIHIKDMTLYNPHGFSAEPMVIIPEIYIRYSPLGLLRGKLYFYDIRFHLEKLAVEKNEKGYLNLQSMRPLREETDVPAAPDIEKEPRGPLSFHVEYLVIRADKVTYTDRTRSPASERSFDVGVDEIYEDIDDLSTLVQLIIASTIRKTVLPSILNLPMGSVQKILDDYGISAESVGETVRKTQETVRSATEKGRDFLEGIGSVFEGRAE